MQNNKLLLNFRHIVLAVLCIFSLVACVTEQTAGTQKKAPDKNKALDLHVQMALGYIDKGNRESARHHLKKAFELDKDNVPATDAMAMLYLLEGEPALAEEQFKLALKRNKNFTQAHNDYGIYLFNQKRYEEAYEQFEKASSDLGYTYRAQALTNLGRSALKVGKNSRAQSAFEHATVLDHNSVDAYIELADIHFQKQEYSEAKKYLDVYAQVNQHTARSLLLAIRLEKVFGNKDKEASLALELKNRYPYSKEYLDYKQAVVY